mmetsp:Transcript_9100/g.22425  ORF Transcript_9100/g.22425 Transcript_9100/m.22425 type:complete len:364 (-) Transcript_9100:87-1178(-)
MTVRAYEGGTCFGRPITVCAVRAGDVASSQLRIEHLLDLVHRVQHPGVGWRRTQKTRHHPRVQPLPPTLFQQLAPRIQEPFVLALRRVDGVRHHGRLDDVDGVEDGPVAEPARAAGNHDLDVGRNLVLVSSRKVVLSILKDAKVNCARRQVARQGGTKALERPADPAKFDRLADALSHVFVRRHVLGVLLGLEDLALPLRLVKVNGGLENGACRPRHHARLAVRQWVVRAHPHEVLSAGVAEEERGSEEHLACQRRGYPFVQPPHALRLDHLLHRVQRPAVDGVLRRLRLKQHLDGVEGVPKQRDGNAAAGPSKHILGRLDHRLLQLALHRHRLTRRVRGESRGHARAADPAVRGRRLHSGRV